MFNSKVVSCSPDKMVMAWDAEVGQRIRKWAGHTSHVNSCGVSRAGETDTLIVSGGDDGLTKVRNARSKCHIVSMFDFVDLCYCYICQCRSGTSVWSSASSPFRTGSRSQPPHLVTRDGCFLPAWTTKFGSACASVGIDDRFACIIVFVLHR